MTFKKYNHYDWYTKELLSKYPQTEEGIQKFATDTDVPVRVKHALESGGLHLVYQVDDETGASVWSLMAGPYRIFGFTLSMYPACCGIRMFHSFSTSVHDYDKFKVLFQPLWNRILEDGLVGEANRIETIMVESFRSEDREDEDEDDDEVDYTSRSHREYREIPDPHLNYKPFWTYWKETSKFMRDRISYNANSGNLLHNIEVVF